MSKKDIKWKYFDLTLEECKQVLNTIEGLLVIDSEHRIKYISPDLADELADLYKDDRKEQLVGQKVEDIHPISKIQMAFQKDRLEEDYVYMVQGLANVARIRPVYQGKNIWGAIDYDLFTDTAHLSQFISQIDELVKRGIICIPKDLDETQNQPLEAGKHRNVTEAIIGKSQAMRELRQMIYKVADSDSTILLRGETGCGKELVSKAIHSVSRRTDHPMVVINCAAIPEALFESELFGFEEGSFTGAIKGGRKGKFELADKGTVFLDEIDQLPYHIQPKLLRVLQEREVDRIGSKKVPVDIRVIAATNKPLKQMVEQGTFREDLYYRLNIIDINIPPLRQRKEDIPLLIEERIQQLNKTLNCKITGISKEAMELFMRYNWPGNIRELFNMVERGMNIQREGVMPADCFQELRDNIINSPDLTNKLTGFSTLEMVVASAEAEAIKRGLDACSGNKSKAAEMLGISRTSLHYKMKKYQI